MTAKHGDVRYFSLVFSYLFGLSNDASYENLFPSKVYRKLPLLFKKEQLPFQAGLLILQLHLSKLRFRVLHQVHFLLLLHIRTIISAYLIAYLKSIQSFIHAISKQKVSDKIIYYF